MRLAMAASWTALTTARTSWIPPTARSASASLGGPRYASVYQHFEGDYVEFDRLPSINNGVLSLAGRVKGGVWFRWPEKLAGGRLL